MIPPLEVCASSLASAVAAYRAGASRIELCSSLEVGGITPSIGLIETVASHVKMPVHVLIRPRNGGFVYSTDEIEIIKSDIKAVGEAESDNVVGVVVGALNDQREVNVPTMTELVDLATENGLSVTFHRAFDDIEDWKKALEDIIAVGCERVLTSGGGRSCAEPEAMRRLQELCEQAEGRVYIMAGAGVTEDNVVSIVKETGVDEVHASCKTVIRADEQEKSKFSMDRWETDEGSVLRVVQQLSTLDD